MNISLKILLTYFGLSIIIAGGMVLFEMATGLKSGNYHILMGTIWFAQIPVIIIYGLVALWS